MIRWYSDDSSPIPTEVECADVGYPHFDREGRTQYENTHFDSNEAAWNSGRRSVEAGVSIAGRDVQQAEDALEQARVRAGHMAKQYAFFMDAERRRAT